MTEFSQYQRFIDSPAKENSFIPKGFELNNWNDVLPYFEQLLNREIIDSHGIEKWLFDKSELDSMLEENLAWRYIKMTIDTSDEKAVERYTYFLEEIEPHVSKFQNDLDLKLNSLPGFDLLDFQGAEILRKNIRKDIEIFRGSRVHAAKK